MQIGQINYARPSEPVEFKDVEYILTMAGKDVIKIAWSRLNPNSSNEINESLEHFFESFFNLKEGEGRECTKLLSKLNLLKIDRRSYTNYYSPTFK